MNKTALIFGISGQDGSYLANFLLSKDYKVYGSSRDKENSNFNNLEKLGIKNKIQFATSSVEDFSNVSNIIKESLPDEIYYLAGQSSVALSFNKPAETLNSNILGILNVLEACRLMDKEIRVYYAGSSECFGDTRGLAATEKTPFHPKSPYAVAKTSAFWLVNNYRAAYNLFICTGILFNHESPRRGETFVTKKITKAVARIHQGKQKVLKLGNLDAKRDWGHARDFVYAQWLMLQQDQPKDYVIATGENHTVREFVELSFNEIGIVVSWKGKGTNEKGFDTKTGDLLVEIDEKYFRPSEVELLLGDPSKAEKELGWKRKISFQELVSGMVQYDLKHDGYGGLE